MRFISCYIKEQKRYTRSELKTILALPNDELGRYISRLKAFGVLKAVRESVQQKDMSELTDEDVVISDSENPDDNVLYVFPFVGVITIGQRVLKCYPKYIAVNTDPLHEMKQVLQVLRRYGAREQKIQMFNGDGQTKQFNLLAVILFLFDDYIQYGLYSQSENIIELNGEGEIQWEKTISDGFVFIRNNRPNYVELFTKRSKNQENDYFRELHKYVLTVCTQELIESGLLTLFDIEPQVLSEKAMSEFGEKEYILYRLESELNVQFNSRKQILLKTLYAFFSQRKTEQDHYGFSMFGTNSFNLVWEKVCSEVLGNKLNTQLQYLPLPAGVPETYSPDSCLIDIIEKPQWEGLSPDGLAFIKEATDTLTPDLICINQHGNNTTFCIFDAKYYCIQLDRNKALRGQPGVGDITKQYLYQLAYSQFVQECGINSTRNCFLSPSEEDEVIPLGSASMEMLTNLGLQRIQIRLLPAKIMFDYYLSRKQLPYEMLGL